MICREILGQISGDCADGDIDWIDLAWQQTLRRALRLVSRSGQKIDVLLPPGARLKHRDILSTERPMVAVWLEEIMVLSIRTDDAAKLARLAFDLGNRHMPAQLTATAVLTPDDGPARAIAAEHGLACEPVIARFFPEPIALENSAFR